MRRRWKTATGRVRNVQTGRVSNTLKHVRVVRRVLWAILLGVAWHGMDHPREAIAAAQSARPIVILISIDGWRWDYLERFKPPTLGALAAAGVRSEGLIPVFPSKTFPNHYTMVTGLYPHRHGIVLNNVVDAALPGIFTLSNPDVQQDTRWWGGVPLWVTVEAQGEVAATMFWPGSDVEIAGHRPTYWRKYQHATPNLERVDQLLGWMREPGAKQPTFLTLYFSEVDSLGHAEGPDSPRIGEGVAHVDEALARLVAGVNAAGLGSRTNYVLVSDHGMAPLSMERKIVLDDYVDLSTVTVQDWSPVLALGPRSPGLSIDALYHALAGKHPRLQVYKLSELPDRYRLRNHPRLAPVIGIADDGWDVTSRDRMKRDSEGAAGTHGYDPRYESMHGLFIASGPAFRAGVVVPRFENVHVYELLCRALDVRPRPNDGDAAATATFFK